MIVTLNERADEFIISELEKLSGEPTSEDKAKTIEALAKLYDAHVKYEESVSEESCNLKKSSIDVVISENEQETAKHVAVLDTVVKIVVPAAWIAFDVIVTRWGFRFEETGSITSHVFKGLWSTFNSRH